MTQLLLILFALTGRVDSWSHYSHFGGVSTVLVEGSSVLAGSSGGLGFGVLNEQNVTFDSTWTYPGKLSHVNVRTLSRDQYGNLWIGYFGGGIDVAHPDGSIQHFGQLEGLPINLEINCILPDSVIWAGTSQGLSIREVGYFQTWTTSNTEGGLPGNYVNTFAKVDSGLIVGTSSGLAMLRTGASPSSAESWLQFSGMEGVNVTRLLSTDSVVWATTTTSLFILEPDSAWKQIVSFPGDGPMSLAERDGILAVGCTGAVWVYDGTEWSGSSWLVGCKILDMEWLADERLLIGVCDAQSSERLSGRGVACGFGSSWHFSLPEGVVSNDLNDVSVEPSGLIWVTTEHQGAGVYDGEQWIGIRSELPDLHQIFTCSSVDEEAYISSYHQGVTWVRFDPESGEISDAITFDAENSNLLNDQIVDVEIWGEGIVWFALELYWQPPAEPSGVCRLSWTPGDLTTCLWRSVQPVDGLPSGNVRCVAPVNDEETWAGTEMGLVRLNIVTRTIIESYGTTEGLPSKDVQSLAMMRNGDVYAGTTGGLARIDSGSGSVTEIPEVEGTVCALSADNLGGLWAATGDALFRILSDGTIEEYNRFNCPLLSIDIRGMACDPDNGLLYLATGDGLWVLDLGEGLSSGQYGPVVYPNPFLPGRGEVLGVAGVPDVPTVLRVFDLTGALLYESESSGRDGIAWNGIDMDGFHVASGTYYVQVVQEGTAHLVKLAIVR